MAYITDTELLYQQLNSQNPISNEQVIKDLIKEDVVSETKTNMHYGILYYKSKNYNINNRNFSTFLNGKNIEDEWRSNNKVANGFLKTLIDQKVNYCLAKPIVINNIDNITSVIDLNKLIRKMSKEASKKGVEWAHPYINKDGELKVINISGQEIIPIYDTTFEQEIIQVIRYYTIQVQEGTEKKDRYKVELWDKEKVTYYMQDQNNNYYFDTTIDPNPAYHWQETSIQLGEVQKVEGHGWGKVPFVPLWNNEEHESDLMPVKPHIDLYDIIESDFANNIEDVQDAVIKLINYSGVTENMSEFLEYLKKYKVLPLDADGNAEYMTMEIPIEARKTMLDILRDNIFQFGQGVDIGKVGDGNITNVVIKARYAGLDLKSNDTEARINEFIEELCWFVNEYLKITSKKQDDTSKMKVTYNRSLIINANEIIDAATKSKGIISDRTIVANHPWVSDPDEELKQMDADKEKSMSMLNLDNPNDNNNDNGGGDNANI